MIIGKKFLNDLGYYMWWLKNNCTLSPERIKPEIEIWLKKLGSIYLKTGDFDLELAFFAELRLYNYDVAEWKLQESARMQFVSEVIDEPLQLC